MSFLAFIDNSNQQKKLSDPWLSTWTNDSNSTKVSKKVCFVDKKCNTISLPLTTNSTVSTEIGKTGTYPTLAFKGTGDKPLFIASCFSTHIATSDSKVTNLKTYEINKTACGTMSISTKSAQLLNVFSLLQRTISICCTFNKAHSADAWYSKADSVSEEFIFSPNAVCSHALANARFTLGASSTINKGNTFEFTYTWTDASDFAIYGAGVVSMTPAITQNFYVTKTNKTENKSRTIKETQNFSYIELPNEELRYCTASEGWYNSRHDLNTIESFKPTRNEIFTCLYRGEFKHAYNSYAVVSILNRTASTTANYNDIYDNISY